MSAADALSSFASGLLVGVGELLHDAGERLLIFGASLSPALSAPSAPAAAAWGGGGLGLGLSLPRLSREQALSLTASLAAALLVPVVAGLVLDLLREADPTARDAGSRGGSALGGRGARVELTKLEAEVARGGLLDAADADAGADFCDVGGLDAQVALLREQVVLPLERPALTAHSRVLGAPTGVLLYGPPGSGKTLLARALARAARARFLALSPSQLQSKWVGDTVRLVAAAFSLARKVAPCIVFIDEIDGLLPSRDRGALGHHTVELTTTFLKEWEGLAAGEGARAAAGAWVLVVGATNRPNDLDRAVLRRLPKQVEVPLPDAAGRASILRVLLRGERAAAGIDVAPAAELAEGYSGSDLRELVRQAAWVPVREAVAAGADAETRPIEAHDLVAALAAAPRTGVAAAEFARRERPPRGAAPQGCPTQ